MTTPETDNTCIKDGVMTDASKYVVLMETNGKECESWYYFIKYEGNEDSLNHLQKQLEKVDWFILEDLSTFDLDLENFVTNTTAKEMTRVDLNCCSFHRKFDGQLRKIDLGFHRKDDNEEKITKIFDILGYGQIEDYINDEDIDSDDMIEESSDEDETAPEPKTQKEIEEEWIPPALRDAKPAAQQKHKRTKKGKKKR